MHFLFIFLKFFLWVLGNSKGDIEIFVDGLNVGHYGTPTFQAHLILTAATHLEVGFMAKMEMVPAFKYFSILCEHVVYYFLCNHGGDVIQSAC